MTAAPADRPLALAAVDLGASSGRVILGHVGRTSDGSGVLDLREVHRFRNGPVRLPNGLYWDMLGLYLDVLTGLRSAVRETRSEGSPLAGLAVDSWAVDYGLIDASGALVGNPRHYRDNRTETVVDAVHAKVGPARLYAVNGLQFLPFNTIYQFAAEPHLDGTRALLVPDLLGYWLTGRMAAEETNASTTGLLDATTGEWSPELLTALGLPRDLLPGLVRAGDAVGQVTREVRAELGADQEIALTAVGSHDTASAIVGVPAATQNFGYISCGTWGLVGVELDAPVLTEESRAANFTNERGVDGTIRYLRNVMGLWLLSESVRTWTLAGHDVDLDGLLAEAARLPADGPRFDPDDPSFLPPGDMPSRIAQACRDAGERVPRTMPEVARCILDSLAAAFARTIEEAQALSGRPIDVVHIVGGGSQNPLLCQLIADIARRPVVAGPVEATAIGNLLIQARTHRTLAGSLQDLRALIRAILPLDTYDPRHTGDRAAAGSRP
jgi:rhamnulokinase